VKRIAIIGGIGSGKSAVTDYLTEKGWPVVDADIIARQVVEPGSATLQTLVDAFGSAILRDDGSLDREFVATLVFNSASALQRLNRITHTAIGLEIVRQLDQAKGPVVFVAIPLFRLEHRTGFSLDEVWCVSAPPEIAVQRLVEKRAMTESDARARLGAQISLEEREKLSDVVISNNGSLIELHRLIDTLLEKHGYSRA
jgi:dephospho-CoA kinase